jgi:hypothetical protein
MKTLWPIALTLALLALPGAAGTRAQECTPDGDVTFVCNQAGPEDLVAVPGTHWVLAGAYQPGNGGLRLIDTRDLSTTVLLPSDALRERHDRDAYPTCPGPIVAEAGADFDAHGLHIAQGPAGVHTLYVVHHNRRESVEVFELDVRQEPPVLTWIGCALAPAGENLNLNSVVELPEGGFAATSFRPMGGPIESIIRGEISGAIWEWQADSGWSKVPGSDTAGPNGLEISPDGRWFYIGGWGPQALIRLSRGRTPVERDEVPTGFRIDNLRMAPDGTTVLAAGQGGNLGSPRGTSNVARVDPDAMTSVEIVNYPNSDLFGTGTVALEVGDEIWVGSLQGDRIARFPSR